MGTEVPDSFLFHCLDPHYLLLKSISLATFLFSGFVCISGCITAILYTPIPYFYSLFKSLTHSKFYHELGLHVIVTIVTSQKTCEQSHLWWERLQYPYNRLVSGTVTLKGEHVVPLQTR